MRVGFFGVALLSWALLALAAQPLLAEDRLGAPGMGDSEDVDDHKGQSEDLDSHQGQSQNPDDLVVGSTDVDDHIVESTDVDDHIAESENLDDHTGHSTDLQDLPDADKQVDKVEQETLTEMRERYRRAGIAEEQAHQRALEADPPDSPLDAQIAALHAAKADVAVARDRAANWDNVYGTMMDNDYPRGEERLKIVDERKVAHEALKAAEQRYQDVLSGNAGPASN